VPEAGFEERGAETAPGEVRPQAEPDLDRARLARLTGEEADELAGRVLDRRICVAPPRRIEQLGQIVRIRVPVVERIRLGVAPA
jgi:hypothetical protein